MTDMKIYVAASIWFGAMPGQPLHEREFNDYEKKVTSEVTNQLESFHYIRVQRKVNELHALKRPIFLDSGAFSAYTLGINLSVEEYCDFVKKNDDFIRKDEGVLLASVLDGIGDALVTYRNQLEMESRGVRPLPCFHAGEDERYLEYYMKNYEYITLGGMVGASVLQLQIWLDRIWSKYLLDGNGNAKLKVHGFGITSFPLMERYPWYSVDSSTWIQTASFGSLQMTDGTVVTVSAKSPSRHDRGKHYLTMSIEEQRVIEKIVADNGFDLQRCVDSAYPRAAYNLWAYSTMEREINARKAINGLPPLPRELF